MRSGDREGRRFASAVFVVALAGCRASRSDTPAIASAAASAPAAASERDAATGAPTGSGALALPPASASAATAGAPTAAGRAVDGRSVAWATGDDVGAGVAMKDTENPRGESVFVGFAGYQIPLEAAEAWVERLYEDDLAARGVRYVYAVQGPADVWYKGAELGTDRVARSIVRLATERTRFVVFAAHSSGAYVAHALLDQLADGFDPRGVTDRRIVYFDLDGGDRGLTERGLARCKKAFYVAVVDPKTKTHTPHRDQMKKIAEDHSENGVFLEERDEATGCEPGASWCMHMALVTTLPHDKTKAGGPRDYTDWKGRGVAHRYLDDAATEAGLSP